MAGMTHRWTLSMPIKTFNETRRGPPHQSKGSQARETCTGTSNLAPDLKQLRLIFPLI